MSIQMYADIPLIWGLLMGVGGLVMGIKSVKSRFSEKLPTIAVVALGVLLIFLASAILLGCLLLYIWVWVGRR